ncbi:hypothetical protein Ais01nite_67260 [Asanoa ishikariensis]|uniref:Uncharacterized protein n=1 Tax=Asanoa ishikariensis TaxID=137265 RepID=A0A1H3NDR2_9ACTN|nr:hypothetical protein [Asanoa ishikariensis]GIF68691.1 hypothetical protein Ais01nite_67260 [Asanoa ishikariensis]SDY86904.1 hypothetical protein SAMN05421684_2000 [Asanoa ishikariensis]
MIARRLTAQFAPAGGESGRPFYARALRLRHLNPSSTVCFVFLEGATAFAVILALAELIPMWGVVLLPICIAAMVKINDLVAGAAVKAAATRTGGASTRRPMRPFRTIGRATVPGGAGTDNVGRVYRSTVPETAATPDAATASKESRSRPAPFDDDDDWDDEPEPTEARRRPHGGVIPAARPANPAAAVNSPPVDLDHGKAARTATAREWAADVFDTPTQRARHSATRRYE